MSAEPTDLHEADAMGNEMLATAWAFLQEHGFAVLALIIIYAIVRPKIDAHLQRKHREQVMKRATDPVLHKDAREEMRRVREEQQRRWSEQAAKAAEELQARQRAKKLEKHREAKKASRSMGGSGGGGPLGGGSGGGRGPSRIIGGPSSRYQRRGGG